MSAAPPYITPGRVRNYTGVTPDNLDLSTDDELNEELVAWIEMAQEMAEEHCEVLWIEGYSGNEDFVIPQGPPAGVQNAVMRIVANMVAQARIRRTYGVLQLDEFRQQMVPDRVFTKAITDDLDMYVRGGNLYRRRAGRRTGLGFSMFRVPSTSEIEQRRAQERGF